MIWGYKLMPRLSGPKRREKQNKIRGKNANASDIRSIKITSNKDKSKVVDVLRFR